MKLYVVCRNEAIQRGDDVSTDEFFPSKLYTYRINFAFLDLGRINKFVENLQSWIELLVAGSLLGAFTGARLPMHVGTPGGGTLITRFSKTSLGIALMV